jgi:hypothetical protein
MIEALLLAVVVGVVSAAAAGLIAMLIEVIAG